MNGGAVNDDKSPENEDIFYPRSQLVNALQSWLAVKEQTRIFTLRKPDHEELEACPGGVAVIAIVWSKCQ
jgi:hypothetical protein